MGMKQTVGVLNRMEADGIIAPEEFRVMRILRRLWGLSEDEVSRLISR